MIVRHRIGDVGPVELSLVDREGKRAARVHREFGDVFEGT